MYVARNQGVMDLGVTKECLWCPGEAEYEDRGNQRVFMVPGRSGI